MAAGPPPPSPVLAPQLFEFSIPQKQYTAWSRTVQNCGLHKAWLERDSPITHIAFNPQNPAHILLHDVYMFCVLDKSLVSGAGGAPGGLLTLRRAGGARGGHGRVLGRAGGHRGGPEGLGQLMPCPRSPCPMPAPP